jgi:EAL domain-containing protein (putative c-di-GMP-specific phosphodiesterase class I)
MTAGRCQVDNEQVTRAGLRTATPPSGTPAAVPAPPAAPAVPVRPAREPIAELLSDRGSLRTVYQPVLDLRTGRVAGYEALTRLTAWPARSPRPWFSAAAHAGLAGQFEAAALRSSLSVRAELEPDQFLAVNVDPAALGQPAVTETLLEVDLHGLIVELADLEPLLTRRDRGEALLSLRDRGLLLAADVRGAGAEELRRVVAVRPDLVILDSTLVAGVHADPVLDRLVRLVMRLADDLGATVLAGGIEDLRDARHLQVGGITLGQGWLFGRARPGLRPASPKVADWLTVSWQEATADLRIAALAGPEPGWRPELDATGTLTAVVTPQGRRLPGNALIHLAAGCERLAAARRVMVADPTRRALGVIALTCDDGSFGGLVGIDRLLRHSLDEVAQGRPVAPRQPLPDAFGGHHH